MSAFSWSSTTGAVGVHKPNGKQQLTISDLYLAVERDYQINKRKSLRNIKASWKLWIQPAFGGKAATLITTEEIESYVLRRQQQEAANATINRELSLLKHLFTLALRGKKLTSSPYIPTLKERNVRKGFVKDADYVKLAEETGRIGLWLRTLFECAYTYGFRKSELLSMKVAQFDTAARSLSLEAGETKNDEARRVDLSEQPQLFELLRECVSGKGPDDLIFTREKDATGRKSRVGGKIVDFRKDWKLACERAGVPKLLFHDLRRTGVSNMIRDGLDEKVAMTISGHKTRSVFDRYHIVRPEALKDAAIKMAKGARERQRAAIIQEEFFTHTDPDRKAS